jgi:hypothetical protein
MPFNAGTADAVLRSLLDTSQNEYLTYDGARQLVWAIETIVHEFETANVPQSLKLAPEARKFAASLGEPNTVGINSELPSGRHLSIYPDYLKNNLAERAEFDSGLVRQRLQTIKAALR